MSEPDSGSVTSTHSHVKEPVRPQTVLLTKLQQENNSSDDDTNIGDVFFSKHVDDDIECTTNDDMVIN